MDGDGAGEGLVEAVLGGDVHPAPFDEGVLGPAARAGEEPDGMARLGQLEREGGADGAGAGDDVELHGMPPVGSDQG
ncbi:hypothetical protein [Nocardioides sp. TF02-7]|uniref:hypothetical protein n=1 Tax=Nocardioides sp. TF02-7 TaxID=2917724 RepID=UPI001F069734|nr:hypothetical protein [Nocardioides sp. TF02-7]UMG93249.1 hypothetical protein MF408_02850 [Nocardioides sp. TF02-7]